MLFDLRGRGRRRTIQVIYLCLAIIMAVGLIGFGIGGATTGGLFDFFGSDDNSGGGSNDVFQKRVDANVAKLKANPNDAAVLAALVTARYQLALDLGANQDTIKESNAQAQLAARTWDRYLRLNPDPVDDRAARSAVNLFDASALDDPAKAAEAQEFVIDASGDAATSTQYASLFQYAYAANQTRKADLAYAKALELAPSKDSRAQIKATMDQIKQQAAGGTSTTPSTAGSATGE